MLESPYNPGTLQSHQGPGKQTHMLSCHKDFWAPPMCQALGYKEERTYGNISKVNEEKGMQTNNYKWGDDGSIRGMNRGMGKGAPGKMSREGGTVAESGRGQLGECCSWGKHEANTTRPWMTGGVWSTMCSRSLSGRRKKEKKCKSYACSQFCFSEHRWSFLTTAL